MNEAILGLALILRAENDALAAGDAAAASRLLPDKQQAVAALRGATPFGALDLAAATELRGLVGENSERLALAIDVQGRILELVGRAARHAQPAAAGYGRQGAAGVSNEPVALTVRA